MQCFRPSPKKSPQRAAELPPAGLPAQADRELWFDAEEEWPGEAEAEADESCPPRALAFSAQLLPASGPLQPCDSDEELPAGMRLPDSVRAAKLAAMRKAVQAGGSAEAALWEDRSPATLERFLRARDYHVDVAAALFLEHRAWRESFGWHVPASRVTTPYWAERKIAIQALSTRGGEGRLGVGCPLLVLVARNHVAEGRVLDEMRRAIIHTMDRVMDALPAGGRAVVLVDLVGLAYRNADVAGLVACFDILQKFYVERVEAMWFVQPPALFWAIWKVVRPFVAAKTRDKIHFVSSKNLPPLVLARYEAKDVPAEYGGAGEFLPLAPDPLPWEAPGLARRRRF